MEYAPIVLFTYNRPLHLGRVIEALKTNIEAKHSNLIIYSDAAKNGIDKDLVNACRKFIRTISGFRNVKIIERQYNFGLAQSVILGVTEVLRKYGKIIVLEDDLLVSSHFLNYMNTALKLYEDNARVASIHGYVYPHKEKIGDYFFLKGADCWGWATWSRAWNYFSADSNYLISKFDTKELIREFNFNNSYDYFGMLKDQVEGRNNSWAIRWYASAFINNMYTLYPNSSFVQNIGLDGSGTHMYSNSDIYNKGFSQKYIPPVLIKVESNKKARKAFIKYFRSTHNNKHKVTDFLNKVKRYIKKMIRPTITKPNWEGPVNTWEEAQYNCNGYSFDPIIDTVFKSASKVRDGLAIFERDSVLFDKVEYSWPVTAFLLKAAIENGNSLNILDIGGALGSHYYQNRLFLESIKNLKWTVLEQDKMVSIGKREFCNTHLNFVTRSELLEDDNSYNVFLLSSVIPYLGDGFGFLNELLSYKPEYIIMDRTFVGPKDMVYIQNVNESIYKASYPLNIYRKETILRAIPKEYELIYMFDSIDGRLFDDVYSKGFVWKIERK